MIRGSLISTADCGEIQVKSEMHLAGYSNRLTADGFAVSGVELFLKPSQQRKLRSLITGR
jgi:hypothetical protein